MAFPVAPEDEKYDPRTSGSVVPHVVLPENDDRDRMLKYFKYSHLRDDLVAISKPFANLAQEVVTRVPMGPERTVSLRKLLEAKDCAVRAVAIPER